MSSAEGSHAESGGGTLTPGRHIAYEETPMSNLYLSMLQRQGVKAASFGDSTGTLAEIG